MSSPEFASCIGGVQVLVAAFGASRTGGTAAVAATVTVTRPVVIKNAFTAVFSHLPVLLGVLMSRLLL